MCVYVCIYMYVYIYIVIGRYILYILSEIIGTQYILAFFFFCNLIYNPFKVRKYKFVLTMGLLNNILNRDVSMLLILQPFLIFLNESYFVSNSVFMVFNVRLFPERQVVTKLNIHFRISIFRKAEKF